MTKHIWLNIVRDLLLMVKLYQMMRFCVGSRLFRHHQNLINDNCDFKKNSVMNIYYLKRFRKIAYNSVMLQMYNQLPIYCIIWRLTKQPYSEKYYSNGLEEALIGLAKVRRDIILVLLKGERSHRNSLTITNRKLAKL